MNYIKNTPQEQGFGEPLLFSSDDVSTIYWYSEVASSVSYMYIIAQIKYIMQELSEIFGYSSEGSCFLFERLKLI